MAADSSRDPISEAKLERLEAELTALREEFQAGLAQIEGAAAETKAAATELRGGRGAKAAPVELSAAEPSIIEKATANMEALAAAEQKAAAAATERLGTQLQEVRAIQEAAASLGGQRAAADESSVLAAARRVEAAQAEATAIAAQAQAVSRAQGAAGGAGAGIGSAEQIAAAERVRNAVEGVRNAPGLGSIKPVEPIVLSSISDLTGRQQALVEQARSLAPAERVVSNEMEYQARTLSLSSLAYRQHGALTTEFIAAAAKGQVTIRELGDQMLLTIGKFAGWTAAAAATYGALGALTAVGKGAVDTASGVSQLQRFLDNVDTSKAQEQFRSLSETNNVSIKDSADAVAAFAKIFQNQDQAVQAADVALKATQLDQISLADSTRFLTGTIVGFRLPASQLAGVFDQINNAQRRFGASVAQTLAAMGGSAAAVRNAGGDFNTYVALVTAAQRATAQTGSVIGTAFRRSATTFVTKPTNIAILKSFGLDPTEAYTQLVLDAVKKAKSLSGAQINQLAQGLGGPQQGARVFAGLLQRPDLVDRALNVTKPINANGSAAQEMGKRLSQADQIIKSVAFSLERLGSALAQSGALTPFVGILEAFGQVANLVTHLIDLIDRIPGGLSQVLIPLGEIYAIVRLLSRRDLGALIPERYVTNRPGGIASALRGTDAAPGLLRPTAERAIRTDINKGLDEQAGYYQELRARQAKAAAQLSVEVEAQKSYVRSLVASNAEGEQVAAEMAKLTALQQRAARITAEEAFYRSAIIELDQTRVGYLAGIRSGLGAEQAALAAGIRYRPGTIERPGAGAAEPIPIAGGGAVTPSGIVIPPGAKGLTDIGAGTVEKASEDVAVAQAGLAGRLASMNSALADTGTGGLVLSRGLGVAGTAATRTAGVIKGVAVSASGFLSKSLDPLTASLIGIPIALEGISAIGNTLEDSLKKSISLANASTPAQLDAVARQAKAASDSLQTGIVSRLQEVGHTVLKFGLGTFGVDYNPPQTPGQDEAYVAKEAARRADELRYIQAHGRGLYESAIQSQLGRAAKDASTQKELDEAIAKGWDEVTHDYERTFEGGKKGQESVKRYAEYVKLVISQAAVTGNTLRGVVNSFTTGTQLDAFLEQNQLRFDVHGPSARLGFTGAAAAQARVAQLISQTTDPKEITKLVEAYSKAASQIKTNADAAQTNALQLAGSDPGAQIAARSAYLDRLREDLGPLKADIADAEKGMGARNKQISDLKRQINGLEQRAGAFSPVIALALTPERSQLLKLQDAAKTNQKQVDVLNALLHQQQQDLKVARDAAARADLDAQTALNDARTAYQQALTQNPVSQAGIAAAGAQRDLQNLTKSGINDPVKKLQDLTAIAQAAQQQVDAQLQTYTANLDLQFAQADIGATQQTQLDNEVTKAQDLVAHLRSLGSKVDPSKITAALTTLANARAALVTFLQQQRIDEINSKFALLEAQTTDPIRIDQLEIAKDRQLLTQARTKSDRQNAEATVLKAQQALVDEKVSEREQTIQFQLSIGEITTQQAEADIQNLLKQRDLSVTRRRELRQLLESLIHQGNQEASGFDLNVSGIRIPTAYDVRRAYQEANRYVARSERPPLVVHNTNHIDIKATSKEAEHAVYAALDRLLTTNIRKAAKTAGLRR